MNAIAIHKGGKSARQVCKDLGIPLSTFLGWVKTYGEEGKDAFTGSGNVKVSEKDFHELRKKLEDSNLERDILKKALAIFSKQK